MAIDDMQAYEDRYRTALTATLRAHREDAGVTFRQLAEYTGLDVHQIHRYLSGKRDIPFPRLHALADGIGVDLISVMQDVEERLS